ncbi:hypothetical protein H4S08_004700, partial [Coemansia sp. RSA 1365]
LNDDAFVEIDYVIETLRKFGEWSIPVFISHNTRKEENSNSDVIDDASYESSSFYMFNRALVKCLDTNIKYKGPRNEDSIFNAMISSGCGEANVNYVAEDSDFIWHKEYKNKNKFIDLSYIDDSSLSESL